jgi:hypothetical protein
MVMLDRSGEHCLTQRIAVRAEIEAGAPHHRSNDSIIVLADEERVLRGGEAGRIMCRHLKPIRGECGCSRFKVREHLGVSTSLGRDDEGLGAAGMPARDTARAPAGPDVKRPLAGS